MIKSELDTYQPSIDSDFENENGTSQEYWRNVREKLLALYFLNLNNSLFYLPDIISRNYLRKLTDEEYYLVQKRLDSITNLLGIFEEPNFYRWHMGDLFFVPATSLLYASILSLVNVFRKNIGPEGLKKNEKIIRLPIAILSYGLAVYYEYLQSSQDSMPLDVKDIAAYTGGLIMVFSDTVMREQFKSFVEECRGNFIIFAGLTGAFFEDALQKNKDTQNLDSTPSLDILKESNFKWEEPLEPYEEFKKQRKLSIGAK